MNIETRTYVITGDVSLLDELEEAFGLLTPLTEIVADNTKEAFNALREALKEDEGYYRAWQDNIAVAFKDEYENEYNSINLDHLDGETLIPDIHIVANEAAKNFLNQLISS